MHDLIIRGGRIATASGLFDADLAVTNGRISAIGSGLDGAETVDATGHLVMPGGVDPHCHIEQMSGMGVMNADTFETATRSAALGGTTSVISFAAQAKGQRLSDAMADYAQRAARGAAIDHAFHISVCDTEAPDFQSELGTLIAAGHRSVKVFTTYNIKLSDHAILDVMSVARRHGALVCVHAENDGLIGWTKAALVTAGDIAPRFHALSHPKLAEVEAVERLCRFAEFFATPVMLFHISAAESLDAIRRARGRGVPVWAETCPHYLMMTSDVLDRPGIEGAKWMCSPPQRSAQDQTALWAALDDGTLDLVSSDHAPYRFDDTGKLRAGPNAPFPVIANGMPGLEVRLPLLFDALVASDHARATHFVRLTASEPARIYGLPTKGDLVPGKDADITIWDPGAVRTYADADLNDNVGYNPWVGRTIRGRVRDVFLRGRRIVDDGRWQGQPGSGHWLARHAIGVSAAIPPAPEVQHIEDRS